MSIKEKLQQLQVDRARQEAERVRREQEVRELEGVQRLANEARREGTIRGAKAVLESKGITRMMKEGVLPVLQELGCSVRMEDAVRDKKVLGLSIQEGLPESIGFVISGTGPKFDYQRGWDSYDYARLGIYIDSGLSTLHVCAGCGDLQKSQFSINDSHLVDKIEDAIAKILSEKEFCFDGDHSTEHDYGM